jgi:hypothetical protein
MDVLTSILATTRRWAAKPRLPVPSRRPLPSPRAAAVKALEDERKPRPPATREEASTLGHWPRAMAQRACHEASVKKGI